MADNSKLWFELGVRDEVNKALKKDIELSERLSGSIEKLVRDYSRLDSKGNRVMGKKDRKELDDLIASSNKYLGVLEKIKIQRDRLLTTRKKAAGLGLDTTDIDKAIAKLNAWEGVYKRIANSKGTSSAKLGTKLGAEFQERMRWLDKLIISYNKLIGTEEREAVAASRALQQANMNLSASYDKVTQSANKNMSTLAMLRQQAGYYLSLFGAKTLFESVITTGGQFEYQETALKNILGDAKQAKIIFSELKDLAIESPKTLMELMTSAKQLSAYQIPSNELFDTTRRLSDLSVGLGVDINRLILAYGQVRSAAVLRGQELRQFTEAGIPIVQALADKFTEMNGKLTTTADVFKLISQRAVPFEMVKEILWDMTNEGGRFYNMQAEMADTLYGKWQKLADIWQITLGNLANTNFGGFKPFHALLDGMVFAARNLQSLLPIFTGIVMSKGLKSFYNSSISTMFSTKGLDANIEKAQKLQALELRRRFVNGEINKEIYKQSLALNAEKENYYMLLAAEGKISDVQIRRLIQEGKITEEKIRQGVANGTLLEQEAMQLRLLMQQNAAGKLGTAGGLLKNAGNSLMNFAGGPMGIAMAYISVWASIYSSYEAWSERIEERARSAADTARNNANEIGKTLETYNKLGAPQDRDDLSGRIDQMKQILENSGLYTDSIRNQVDSVGTLNEQYNILLKSLREAKTSQDDIAKSQKEMADAIKATGGSDMGFFDWVEAIAANPITNPLGFLADYGIRSAFGSNGGSVGLGNFLFNDDIVENLEEYSEYLQKVEAQMSIISGYKDEYEAVMKEMSKDKDFALLINGKDPQEALTAIASSEYWDEFIDRMGASGDAFKGVVEKMIDSAEDGNSELQKIVKSDVPDMMKYLAKERGMSLDAYIEYCKKHPEEAERAVNKILSILDIGGSALINFANKLRQTLGLAPIEASKVVQDIYKQAHLDQTQAGRYALGKLIGEAKKNGWGDQNGNGIWTSVWINKYFKKGTNYVEGLTAIRNAWTEMKENREAALAVGAKLTAAEEAEWNRLEKAAEVFNLKEKKSKLFGSDSGGRGSKKDEELNDWKKRIQLLEEYRSQLEKLSKYMTRAQAEAKLKENGNFASLFNFGNPNDYENYLRGAIDALGTEGERGNYVNSLFAKIEKEGLQKFVKDADDAARELQKMLDVMQENYNTYKKWLDLTGDSNLAARIAGVTENSSYADLLKEQYNQNPAEGKTADQFFGLTETEAKKYGENNGLFTLWKKWEENNKKLKQDNLKLYEDAIKNAKRYEEKIEDINRELAKEIAAIREFAGSEEEAGRLIDNATKNADKKKADYAWDQFKEDNDWGRIFGNLDNISTQTMEYMLEKLREVAPRINASVEATKALYEAMEKLQNAVISRNPFAAISDALSSASAYRNAISYVQQHFGNVGMNDEIHLDANTAKSLGLKNMENGFHGTYGQLFDALKESQNKFVKAVGDVGKAFKSLQDVLSPVIDLFDTLGETTLSDIFKVGSNALGSAATVAQGMSSLQGMFKKDSGMFNFLGAAGPYGAAAAAALSMVTSLFNMQDAALQKEIEASKQRQKELENLTKNLDKALERMLGGIYRTPASESDKDKLREYALKYDVRQAFAGSNTIGEWIGNKIGGHIENDTREAIEDALNSESYYDTKYAELLMQRDELIKQQAAEREKKKSDDGAISDYDQQIEEIKDEIENFAEDVAKAIYDIDIKSWASELGDALFEAWQKGEDGIEAFKKKANEMIAEVAKKIVTMTIIETALDPVLEVLKKQMAANDGKLTAESIGMFAEEFGKLMQTLPDDVYAAYDAMDKKLIDGGLGSMKETDDSNSSSNGIKGITEGTADLLASYINAIRADVSINRVTLQQILYAVQTQTEMPAIARAQLAQLQTLVSLAQSRNVMMEDIYSILHRVEIGQTYIKVQ